MRAPYGHKFIENTSFLNTDVAIHNMVSIEKIKRGGAVYYYISKNFRVDLNKWRKIRRYLGSAKPSKAAVAKIAREIEKEAEEKGIVKKQPAYAFLTDDEAEVIEDIKERFKRFMKRLPKESASKYMEDFLIRFTYNSNAIEGNRLSLRDTHLILQENIIPHDATSYEYNEVINSRKCMDFIKIYKGELNQKFLLRTHEILTKNTSVQMVGFYRNHDVIITGSPHTPPNFRQIKKLMKGFFIWYNNSKTRHHPLELACLAHTKLTRIHPFSDGNGRAARIISNFILYKNGFPLFFVDVKDRGKYYNALDESDKGNERVFVKFIFDSIIEQLKSKVS